MSVASKRGARLRIAAAVAVTLSVGGCGQGDHAGAGTATGDDLAIAAPASAPPETTTTIRLESQLAAAPRAVGPSVAGPGSQLVFTGMLFKPKGTSAIGRSQGSCTRTARGGGEVYQCLLSFILRDGTIYAQSVASADGPAGGVVTGGTSRYRNMRGTFRFKATGDPRVDLTLAVSR
jgi:hypothetical protein